MRTRFGVALCLFVLFSSGAWAAIDSADTRKDTLLAKCDLGALRSCDGDVDDEAYLGAKVLVVRYGNDAAAIADSVADRYVAEHDDASAVFWRRISVEAAVLTGQR